MSTKFPIASAFVLVVEDDGIVRMVAVDMLEEAGFMVLEAATADAAWTILENKPQICALFTDIDMPGSMNGLALASQVAQRWPHIRLVVTSGRYGLRDKDLPDHGRFLLKPYQQAQLLDAIATAEPHRVSRRPQLLRGWSHDEANPTVFP